MEWEAALHNSLIKNALSLRCLNLISRTQSLDGELSSFGWLLEVMQVMIVDLLVLLAWSGSDIDTFWVGGLFLF